MQKRLSSLARWSLPVVLAATCPAAVHAQVGEPLLIDPAIPQGFDRGRNVSVTERPRPGYEALGITIRSFRLYPTLETGVGGTSNAYLTSVDEKAVPFVYLEPSARLQSLWSRHSLQLHGSAGFRDYIGQSRRNEDVWEVGGQGRADLGSYLTVTAEAEAAREFESLFSGEVSSDVAALSRYRRDLASLTGAFTRGRLRAQVVTDYADYRFGSVRLNDGIFLDQSNRDRGVARATGQVEFARTPSVSLFGQLGYSRTDYDEPLAPDVPNLDSNAYRLLGGVNFDISGRARGSLGVGYSHRSYQAPIYDDIGGVSAQARLELFPTELTTLRLDASRTIQDGGLRNRNAYFDNRLAMRVDHELLRNLLVNATVEIARQDYVQNTLRTDAYRVILGARYFSSHRLGLTGSVNYGSRSTNDNNNLNRFKELRAEAGVVLHL